MIANTFIKRPVTAIVISLVLMISGIICIANLAVDQCELSDQRFTLIAPDNYRGDYLEIKLWSKSGDELAVESLYVED